MHGALKTVWLAGSTCDSDDKYTAGGNYILLPKLKEDEDQLLAILDIKIIYIRILNSFL